jgi:hypothetical protein
MTTQQQTQPSSPPPRAVGITGTTGIMFDGIRYSAGGAALCTTGGFLVGGPMGAAVGSFIGATGPLIYQYYKVVYDGKR